MGLLIIIILFVGLPLLGYFLLTGIFDMFVKKDDYDYQPPSKYIDNSVHHHYHDNRSIYLDGNKALPDSEESSSDI